MSDKAEAILDKAGIRPTANRVLVVRALDAADSPRSLIELETELQTLERSSILRVLTLLLSRHVVHEMEDGRGVSKYELCRKGSACSIDNMHAHFYCEQCGNVVCLDNISVPAISLPEGFELTSVNFMIKGVCGKCHKSD